MTYLVTFFRCLRVSSRSALAFSISSRCLLMSNSEMRRMRTPSSISTSASARSRQHLPAERLEALVHGRRHGLVGLALLDFFVNALLDENALERSEMQFLLQLAFAAIPVRA